MVISCTIVCLLSISYYNLISIRKTIFLFVHCYIQKKPGRVPGTNQQVKKVFSMTEITCSHFSSYTSWSTFKVNACSLQINIQKIIKFSTLDVKKNTSIFWLSSYASQSSPPFSLLEMFLFLGKPTLQSRQKMVVIKEGKLNSELRQIALYKLHFSSINLYPDTVYLVALLWRLDGMIFVNYFTWPLLYFCSFVGWLLHMIEISNLQLLMTHQIYICNFLSTQKYYLKSFTRLIQTH